MTQSELDLANYRRSIAIAQLDLAIDVMSGWRNRYEDDDEPVTLDWAVELMPVPGRKLVGWLEVDGSEGVQGIGWGVIGGRLVLRSRCGSLNDDSGTVTRGHFRRVARENGVVLPSRHATIYLSLGKGKQ